MSNNAREPFPAIFSGLILRLLRLLPSKAAQGHVTQARRHDPDQS